MRRCNWETKDRRVLAMEKCGAGSYLGAGEDSH